MTVSLERRAKRRDIARDLRDPLLLGAQYVALLLDDLVDALVLAANLFEEPREFRGIFNALRRELPYAAGRALDGQVRPALRVVDRAHHLGKVVGIAAKTRHGQHRGAVPSRSAQLGKIDRPRIDEMRHELLWNSFDAR